MARATSHVATDAAHDAIALLKHDHRVVERLFSELEAADDDELHVIAERVCQLLTVHAQIEEELFYPRAKESLEDEDDIEILNEAAVEHQCAKDLIAKIEGMPPEDEQFRATVKVLGEYVKHHVKAEENELLPKLKKTGVDLQDIGAQLFDRKMQLMQEMGIEMETEMETEMEAQEEQMTTRKRAAGRSARGAASKARHARVASGRKGASRSGRAARH